MARNITIGIEDDFFEILERIATVNSADIILVVPKGALLFDDAINLVELKKRTDAAGKNIGILTSDLQGISFSRYAGFHAQNIAGIGSRQDTSKKSAALAQPAATHAQLAHASPQAEPADVRASMPEYIPMPDYAPTPMRVPEPFPEPMPASSSKIYTPEAAEYSDRRPRRILITVFSAAIVILLLLTTVILPQADITIYAKTSTLTRDMQITVDTSAVTPDATRLVIPGTTINQSQKFSQDFQSTGQSDLGQKATGSVVIYNFTGHLLKLGATTTTLTAGSNTYHFVSDASNIKPTKYFANSTNVDSSSLSPAVAIIADQPGDNYNLPQGSRFEIKNAVIGGPSNALYAQNDSQGISGGTTEDVSFVSTDDLASAKTAITSSVISASEQQLASSKNLTLIDSGAVLTTPAVTFNHAVNDQSPSFSGTVSGQLQGLAFSSSDLKKLIEQRIALTLDKGSYLVTSQGESITENFASFVPGAQNAILTVHFTGLVSYNVDTNSLPAQIKGLNAIQIQNLLAQNSNIQGADIVLKPFWVRNAPWIIRKVYITTKLSPQQEQGS
jgi:hypothetical protein